MPIRREIVISKADNMSVVICKPLRTFISSNNFCPAVLLGNFLGFVIVFF
jgi:hypothetical protein